MSVKAVIGQVCSSQQKSLLNLGGMTLDHGIGMLLAVSLTVYLLYALVRAERF